MSSVIPRHFKLIDVLRGICALAVVVFHYQHFYYSDPQHVMSEAVRHTQPFYQALSVFYNDGFAAVQMFWLISGFVFCHVYGGTQSPDLRSYVGNRFSRLYPLHFIALVLVLLLQIANLKAVGHFQIYKHTDALHFVLNLLFVSGWVKSWESFNGPIWSVSVELIVYAGFFAYLFLKRWRLPIAVVITAISLIGFLVTKSTIIQCFSDFFTGILIYMGLVWLSKKGTKLNICLSLAATVGSICIALVMAEVPQLSKYIIEFSRYFLFASVLWLIASVELSFGANSLKKIHWIGDITYASYLMHVPFQLSILLVLDSVLKSRNVVSTGPFFLIYMASIVTISYLTFLFVEKPLQRAFRSAFSKS